MESSFCNPLSSYNCTLLNIITMPVWTGLCVLRRTCKQDYETLFHIIILSKHHLTSSLQAQQRVAGHGQGVEGETDPVLVPNSSYPTGNQTQSTSNIQFLYSSSKEGLRVVSMGVEKAVRAANKGGDLQSQGLSTADAFFSEAGNIIIASLSPTNVKCCPLTLHF
jgi:subtilisin family serine protease